MNGIWFAVIVLAGSGTLVLAGDDTDAWLIAKYLEAMQTSITSLTENQTKFNQQFTERLERLEDGSLQSQSILETKLMMLKNETEIKIEQLEDGVLESKCPVTGSRTYSLKLPHSRSFKVYCENGWILIHRRFNGSLDFNRAWVPYREGFGDLEGEHWLGLDKMHRITRSGSYELLVVLKSFDGVVKTAKYASFKIGSETEQYQLNLGKFVGGDAGDSFRDDNTMKFSTSDRDNDKWPGSCAVTHNSGWWFWSCSNADLNAVYDKASFYAMSWSKFNNKYELLKEARMMIRAV